MNTEILMLSVGLSNKVHQRITKLILPNSLSSLIVKYLRHPSGQSDKHTKKVVEMIVRSVEKLIQLFFQHIISQKNIYNNTVHISNNFATVSITNETHSMPEE